MAAFIAKAVGLAFETPGLSLDRDMVDPEPHDIATCRRWETFTIPRFHDLTPKHADLRTCSEMGIRRLLKRWKGEESPRQKNGESDSRPTQNQTKPPAIDGSDTAQDGSSNVRRKESLQGPGSTGASPSCAPALTDARKTRAETIDLTPPPGAGGTDEREGSLSGPGVGATPHPTSPHDLPTSPETTLEIPNVGADADADEALRNNLHSEGGETEDLWQLSFDELTQEEQGRLEAFLAPGQATASDQRQAPSFKATDFEDLIAVTRAKQEALSDRIWSFDFYGRKIVPRDYTERVITCLTIVGDVGVPLMPQPASIVWPLVKGLMQVCRAQYRISHSSQSI